MLRSHLHQSSSAITCAYYKLSQLNRAPLLVQRRELGFAARRLITEIVINSNRVQATRTNSSAAMVAQVVASGALAGLEPVEVHTL